MNLIQTHFAESLGALANVSAEEMRTLALMAERIEGTLRAGGKLLICGNGGSAADAQHIAAEFVVRYRLERRALAAIALTADTSIITANSNDYSFKSVFSRQIEALGKRGDILIALTTSGMSENVLSAVATARDCGLTVFGFTSDEASPFHRCCDLIFHGGRSVAIAQQLTMVALHAICHQVEHDFVRSGAL